MSKVPALKESLKQIESDRKRKKEEIEAIRDDGWEIVSIRETGFKCKELSKSDAVQRIPLTHTHNKILIYEVTMNNKHKLCIGY